MPQTVPLIEMIAAADAAGARGETGLARALYENWLADPTEDPLLYSAYFNYGLLLSRLQENQGAKIALQKALDLAPDNNAIQLSLGMALEQTDGAFAAACEWLKVIDRFPNINGDSLNHLKIALNMIGRLLEGSRQHSQAEDILRRSLDIDLGQTDVAQHYISLLQQQCKWPIIRPWPNTRGVSRRDLLRTINPLTLAIYTDDPLFQLGNAYQYSKHMAGRPPPSLGHHHARPTEPRNRPLRIGYLSSDLRQHAVGLLTAEVFGLHDRSKVEVFSYYCGPLAGGDPMQQRIRADSDHWRGIENVSDEQAGQTILEDKIDILVDLNGHTHGSRMPLLAMRPAPIIVNWLGYPGSMGSVFHNYIIADPFIVPPEYEMFYTEQVVRLPCYQPNDRQRQVTGTIPTRAEAGLPEKGMVYCAFNGQHKITPYTWKRWTEILKQVDGSVLWLLDSTEEICEQIRMLADSHGVSRDRILFAPRLDNLAHLIRYPLADLFLDTAPYGAHTTASDAMWMGVPILTLAGRSFASRVCGSIISSAGLPDLVCTDGEEYIAKAVELGRAPDKLAAIRARIAGCRESSVLFDTPGLVRALEGLYEGMWEDYRQGTLPAPNLANLDIYHEVGMDLDEDWVEMLSVPDYFERYRKKLAETGTYRYLAPDGRLVP